MNEKEKHIVGMLLLLQAHSDPNSDFTKNGFCCVGYDSSHKIISPTIYEVPTSILFSIVKVGDILEKIKNDDSIEFLDVAITGKRIVPVLKDKNLKD